MWISEGLEQYKLLDANNGERLEQWGDVVLIRPDPQAVWTGSRNNPLWQSPNAVYNRSTSGGGAWNFKKSISQKWSIKQGDLVFNLKPMGFKHTGLFPEQLTNWQWCGDLIKKANRPINVLNLFAYTGGATISAAYYGAKVCHLDASKGMVAMAKDNAVSSKLGDKPIRYIVDDCQKFVQREIRRGNKYDAIIMDPPSYGKGPTGQIWKIEENLQEFIELCTEVLVDEPLFFLLNSYTTGLSPQTMGNMVRLTVEKKFGGVTVADEIGLPIEDLNIAMPCGSSVRWKL